MRNIALCHPRLRELAEKLVKECAGQGIPIKIGETLRTVAEQDALYAQGRTKPGNIVTNAKGSSYSSQHQWGIAFDFYRADGAGAYNESDRFFEKVGAAGKKLGLRWGGEWKSIEDKPHFYLPDWGSTTGALKKQYGTPEKFMAAWPSAKPTAKSDVIIEFRIPVSTNEAGLIITTDRLIIRKMPKGEDTGERYIGMEKIAPLEKCFANGEPWMRTERGWISAGYVKGWILQEGRWWYVEPGYTYPAAVTRQIDGVRYSFDEEGWLIAPENRPEKNAGVI